MLALESLTNESGARHRRKRKGRGMSSGNGHKHKPGFEGGQMRLVRRIPKRGFSNLNTKTLLPVNVGSLDIFEDGTEVTLDVLRESGLANGPCDGVKILGRGECSRKLTV